MDFPLILLLFVLIGFVTRPFLVLFHELGHAIPTILITKQAVSVYIGSYGDPKKSLHFKIGLLAIWFKYNPFSWRQGLCVSSAKQTSVNQQIIFILTGPLSSFIIALVACYFTFSYNLHGLLKLTLIIFLGLSIFDLFVNLIPSTMPIKFYDGRLIYNDGYRLKQLFLYKRFSKAYKEATELYYQEKFEKSSVIFINILKNGYRDENLYRLAISSFLQLKNYKQAITISEEFNLQGKMNSDDFANAGFSYSQTHQIDKALDLYDKSLALNPNNIYSISNKGFTLNVLNKFDEAIPLFDKVIEVDETSAYSFSNRGLAKIKSGKVEEGLEDINYAFKLDENNPYGYRSLGIYHLDKGEYSSALALFKRAKELDNATYMIDELINNAERY